MPVQLQRAMAAEAEAAREARAKVIAAEGEQRASRALKEAAEVINESPAALQVLYIIYSLILSLSLLRQPTSSCSPCPSPISLYPQADIHAPCPQPSHSLAAPSVYCTARGATTPTLAGGAIVDLLATHHPALACFSATSSSSCVYADLWYSLVS